MAAMHALRDRQQGFTRPGYWELSAAAARCSNSIREIMIAGNFDRDLIKDLIEVPRNRALVRLEAR
jgi:hypothetical protein